ncbi:MAG: acyl-CoA dehydrogenase [Bradyrhizobium sp.]|nr:acyl-CoA dehydrogenase [Bradyrhizobium sp.]
MNLDFSEDQHLFRDTVRRFLAERCPPAAVRAILESPEPFDRDLYAALAEMGALGAAIPEAYGGIGLGELELCILAEELGRSLAPVPVSSSIYLASHALLVAGTEAQKQRWLPGLAAGSVIGTFALAESAGRVSPARILARMRNGRLSGIKLPVPDGDVADFAVVAAFDMDAGASQALSLFLVELNGPGVTRKVVTNLDPSRGQARLDFKDAPAERLGAVGEGWTLVERILDRAAILFAFEQLGGADRALEMARDYALERMAFGRQIGSFQALKHMMADMYVSATLARSNAYYGAWALSTGDAELPMAAATARVSATQAFQHCASNNIQIHGGMGFTWEFDCHLYYRRANALALAIGSLSTWEDLLVTRMRPTADADQGELV